MTRLIHSILGFGLSAILLTAHPATAAVFIVNNTQDIPDEFPGNGVCNPVGGVGNTCTLRAAIMEANALGGSHTILVASGTYLLTRNGIGENNALNGDLDIHAEISIANFTNDPPVIFAVNQDRVFDVRPGGSLELINIHVGGGFANAEGNTRGGAFNVDFGASLTLNQVVVGTNIANIGGAIYNDGDVDIVDSEFYNNGVFDHHVVAALVDGSAIFNRGALTIERSTLRHNGLVPGAEGLVQTAYAIRARKTGTHPNPFTSLVNVTVAENTRGIYSGTVTEQFQGMPLDIRMSTIVDNGDRGIRFIPNHSDLGSPQLTMALSVIYGHTFSDCNEIDPTQAWSPVSGWRNASSDASCGFTGVGDQQHIAYPFFGPLDFYNSITPVMMPRPSGSLVDTGGNFCLPTFEDQRGQDRPLDGTGNFEARCDIGAVEYNPAIDPALPGAIFANGFE